MLPPESIWKLVKRGASRLPWEREVLAQRTCRSSHSSRGPGDTRQPLAEGELLGPGCSPLAEL